MNLNVRSRNSYFPLRSLPDVVLCHVAEYLSRRDLQNMAQVDRYLRKLFNSPRLWKDIRIRIPDKKIDPQVLEIFRVRGITDMEIVNVNFDLQLTTLQPHLERLKLRVTTVNTLQVLCKAASSGHLNKLKNLAFGKVDYRIGHQSKVTFLELFKNLPMIEEVRFVSSFTECEQRICVPLTYEAENPLAIDLRQALCCTGKLKSISLTCFGDVGRSWLCTVMLNNPLMQTLSLCHIQSFVGEGLDDVLADPTVCSNLRTFEWKSPVPSWEMEQTSRILSWAFPGNEPHKNLTSLDVSGSFTHMIFPLLHKFTSLKKLNLSMSKLTATLESFFNFQNLEWLELKACGSTTGSQLLLLSDKVGKTLRYLGLARLPLITDTDLRDLATLFPVLKTLDLSKCDQITDAVLVEWYIKHEKNEWPKLRKLILQDCKGITQEMVDSVRLKTRNQLLIDL